MFEPRQRPPRKNERNESFEALAEETRTDWVAGRGELNKALSLIRQQSSMPDTELAAEIHVRARLYHALMPTALLTPTALAKHWLRVKPPRKEKSQRPACETCNNDRLVVARVRDDGTEEYKRCPACCPAA